MLIEKILSGGRRGLLSAACLVVVVMVRGDVAAATRHYSFRNGYPATATRSVGVSAAGEVRRVVAGLEDGERVSLVAADDSGKAKVTNLQAFRELKGLLSAPIGSKYVPIDAAEYDALKKSAAPEILVCIPEWQNATAPKYWQRPRAVLLKGGSLECVGFYSASKVFE